MNLSARTNERPPAPSALSPAPSFSPEHFPAWLLAALLMVATMVLYLPVTQFDFVGFDDVFYVTSNHQVQAGLTLSNISWAFTTGTAANWHPLTWLSLMLDVNIYGTKAAGFHITNVLLHSLDAVLLFWWLWRITGAYGRSFVVALLFAWHPVHVESVAWVSERKDVLSAFFGFLSLLFYTRHAREFAKGKNFFRSRNYWLAWFSFALGLLSKPMLVTWPCVLLLLDYWPLGRLKWRDWWPLVAEKIPFAGLSVAASVVTFLVQREGGAVVSEDLVPLGARVGNALISYVRYLGKIFWPVDLSILYTHQGYWPLALVLLAAAALAALSALFWLHRPRYPYLLIGWLWFLGTLVPVIGLVQVGEQALADRYTYLPSVGIFIMVVWGLPELLGHRLGAVLLPAIAAAALAACLGVTRHQLGFWQNNETLFQRALEVTANSYTVRNNLGKIYLDHDQNEAAATQFREALRLRSEYAPAHYNLGIALNQGGHIKEAIAEFQEALRLQPGDPNIHNNFSSALLNDGQPEAALKELREAIRLQPDFALAHANLAQLLFRLGRTDDARQEYEATLRLQPDNAAAHYNLGGLLLKQGDTEAALAEFQAAVRLNPADAQAHYHLGNLLVHQGHLAEAAGEFETTIRLQPDDAIAHNNLAILLAGVGQTLEAETEFQEALRLQPANAQIHFNFGNALVKGGQTDDAIRQFQEALRLQPNYPAAQNSLASELALKRN